MFELLGFLLKRNCLILKKNFSPAMISSHLKREHSHRVFPKNYYPSACISCFLQCTFEAYHRIPSQVMRGLVLVLSGRIDGTSKTKFGLMIIYGFSLLATSSIWSRFLGLSSLYLEGGC